MGRKNRRKAWTPREPLPSLNRKENNDGRCAYCGRRIYPGGWHWMYDEFGQQVKKCNDERLCRRKRMRTWGQEESYRKAMRRWNS